jgi:hypothetical protein
MKKAFGAAGHTAHGAQVWNQLVHKDGLVCLVSAKPVPPELGYKVSTIPRIRRETFMFPQALPLSLVARYNVRHA